MTKAEGRRQESEKSGPFAVAGAFGKGNILDRNGQLWTCENVKGTDSLMPGHQQEFRRRGNAAPDGFSEEKSGCWHGERV